MWGWIIHFTFGKILLVLSIVVALGVLLTVIGMFGKKIPIIKDILPDDEFFKTVIKVTGLILLSFGFWLKGGYDVESFWRNKASSVAAKTKVVEEKSKKTNTVIQERVIKEIQVINNNRETIKEKIVTVAVTIDQKCVVDPLAIEILNESAGNKLLNNDQIDKIIPTDFSLSSNNNSKLTVDK